jgi:hypothetical protein
MRSDPATLAAPFLQFAVLSLSAIGGDSPAVPEMHRQTVEIAAVAHGSPVQRIVRHCVGSAGTEHHVRRPCWDILSRGCRAPPFATVAMCGPSCVLA